MLCGHFNRIGGGCGGFFDYVYVVTINSYLFYHILRNIKGKPPQCPHFSLQQEGND